MMAGGEAAVPEVRERRAYLAAHLGRVRAARVEAAAARRRDRARHLALEHDLLARRDLLAGVDVGDRREERLGVRVDRSRVEVIGGGGLGDHPRGQHRGGGGGGGGEGEGGRGGKRR